MPHSVSEAFAHIDELDAIAQSVLTDRQREVWNLLCEGKDANEIALALSITPKCARELRARVQLRVREAEETKRLGRFRVAATVQRGHDARFVTDQTAQQAILEADRQLRRSA